MILVNRENVKNGTEKRIVGSLHRMQSTKRFTSSTCFVFLNRCKIDTNDVKI